MRRTIVVCVTVAILAATQSFAQDVLDWGHSALVVSDWNNLSEDAKIAFIDGQYDAYSNVDFVIGVNFNLFREFGAPESDLLSLTYVWEELQQKHMLPLLSFLDRDVDASIADMDFAARMLEKDGHGEMPLGIILSEAISRYSRKQ